MYTPDPNNARGTITEILPNSTFRVQIDGGALVIAYMAGRMKLNRIRVVEGDRVEVVLDPHHGKATNRLVRRLDRHD